MSAILGAPKGSDGQSQPEKRKKESILDLTKFLEKPVRVKFAGKVAKNSILYLLFQPYISIQQGVLKIVRLVWSMNTL